MPDTLTAPPIVADRRAQLRADAVEARAALARWVASNYPTAAAVAVTLDLGVEGLPLLVFPVCGTGDAMTERMQESDPEPVVARWADDGR